MAINQVRIVEAAYRRSPILLFRDNPLIEALPAVLTSEEVFDRLSVAPPKPTARQRALPKQLRLHDLLTLRSLVRPLNDYILFEPKFSMMLRSGYVGRRPRPEQWAKMYALTSHRRGATASFPRNSSTAYGTLLYGLSGLGKTTMVDRVLDGYPEAIIHRDLDGPGSRWTQIVYIKVRAPSNGSILALCKSILDEVARIVGDANVANASGTSIDDFLRDITAVAQTYFIGMIIIDDLQHLNEANPRHKATLLGFLTNLIESGIPILGIGTYSIEPLFAQAFKTARKAGGLGSHEFHRPITGNDPQWKDLVDFAWGYQWLRKFQPLDTTIRDELYLQAVGIPDMLIKILLLTQMVAIGDGSERISKAMIRDVANRDLRLLQPAMNILRRSTMGRSLRSDEALRFDDLFPKGEWFDETLDRALQQGLGARPTPASQPAGKKARAARPAKSAISSLEFDVKDFRTDLMSTDPLAELLRQGLLATRYDDLE